jgi:hypothetical protein
VTTAPHVAVVPHRMVRGLVVPKDETKTWDWTKIPNSPDNTAAIVAHCKVMTIEEACAGRWKSDALMMAPVVLDAGGEPMRVQPRLTKPTLSAVRAAGHRVVCWALMADFDSVPKIEWDDARRLAQLDRVMGHPQFAKGLWYFSARGLRLVQALREPVPVEEYERVAAAWRTELLEDGLTADEFGLHLDPQCSDWTRLQGLRDVQRPDGLFQRYPLGGRLEPRERPTADPGKEIARARGGRAKRIEAPAAYAETLPERWIGRAQALAAALLTVQSGWNDAFLCLSGALVQRGVPAGEIPAIIEGVSKATRNDDRTENRVTNAHRTIELAMRGEPIRGWDALLVGYPRVADSFERALVNLGTSGEVLPSRKSAGLELQEALRNAPEGVSLLEAGCGVGKTYATEDVACERAGRHARHDTKTVISAPTNKLAKQIAANVARRGLPVLRVYSPPSELDADGKPVCKFADSARAIAGAGLSVPFEFCNGRGDTSRACPHRGECSVAEGFEGDPSAKVIVGNHGLLSRLARDAGKTGLLVIDEPPPVLVSLRLESADLVRLRELGTAFASEWYDAIRGAIETAHWWLQDMLPERPAEIARMAPEADRQSAASVPAQPQVRWGEIARARASQTYATMLGQAARAANVLRAVWGSDARWMVWIEERIVEETKQRAIVFTGPDEQLVSVMRREGRTVLMDAAVDARALSAAAGYDLSDRVTRVWARDGAAVARTWLRWGGGARRTLMEGGALQITVFANALRWALRWASEDPRAARVGVFCIKPFRACLDAAIAMLRVDENEDSGNASARARDCLTKAGIPRRYESMIADSLVPVVAQFCAAGGRIETGHYGALRGIDSWIGVDATITLGDPWPALLATRHEHAYFADETSETGGDSRSRWQVERELEQAHGRLRAPGLERPARALHVGAVLPRGPGWDAAEYREASDGRPSNVSTCTQDELREWIKREHKGSIRAAARALSLSDMAVRRYLDPRKSRAISSEVAAAVRGATETPYRDILIRGFGRRCTSPERCERVGVCDCEGETPKEDNR